MRIILIRLEKARVGVNLKTSRFFVQGVIGGPIQRQMTNSKPLSISDLRTARIGKRSADAAGESRSLSGADGVTQMFELS
jgi:hypothetical protein